MTILEVLIAMFILVIVFGAAISAVVNITRVVTAAKSRTRAVALLNQRMEEMRALTFANLNGNLAKSSFTAGTESGSSFSGQSNRGFRWTRTIDTAAADSSSALIKVVVTVTWEQPGVGPRAISGYSYFSKDGVLNSESAAS